MASAEGVGPRSLVMLAAGQGCQYYHMAEELFRHNATFRRAMEECEALLLRAGGRPVIEVIYDPRRSLLDALDEITVSHPAVFMVQYSLARALLKLGVSPSRVGGASLGELVANVLASTMTLEDAIGLVWAQASLVRERCPAGGMMAVLGPAELARREPELLSRCTVVGVNFDQHFVVAGRREDLEALSDALAQRLIPCQMLPVRYAFHTEMTAVIRPDFLRRVSRIRLSAPQIPLVSATISGPPPRIDVEYFRQIFDQPIGFAGLVEYLEATGPHTYLDLSPSGSLATFLRHSRAGRGPSKILPSLSMFRDDLRKLTAMRTALGV